VCNYLSVTRKYELKRRAERQAETRQRIVEAAVELHAKKGPARTTLSDVARLAGVQRHTLYRHFPDERSLFLACSGLHLDANPPPVGEAWRGIADPAERLRAGLGELYAYFERNEEMFASVFRDAEVHQLTRETVELRAGKAMAAIRNALAQGLEAPRQAMLGLALDFFTWRNLHRSGLSSAAAADAMVAAILAQ
jgi:AcrR family transcriptional regulator